MPCIVTYIADFQSVKCAICSKQHLGHYVTIIRWFYAFCLVFECNVCVKRGFSPQRSSSGLWNVVVCDCHINTLADWLHTKRRHKRLNGICLTVGNGRGWSLFLGRESHLRIYSVHELKIIDSNESICDSLCSNNQQIHWNITSYIFHIR